jgi:DNA-binding NarL/FixJ family response regulator
MTRHNPVLEPKYRILIADDQPVFRDGVKFWLEQEADMECCGETEDAEATRRAVAAEKPDVVLLELRLKGDDGLELLRALRDSQPELCVLVVTHNDEMVFGDRVLRAGARGYFAKTQPGSELIKAIRAVLGGDIHVSKNLAAVMMKKLWRKDAGSDQTATLSDRELQVFQMLGSGIGTKQVARQLSLSIKTVETYREHIKRKLGLKDAPSLVHAATTWVEGRGPTVENRL